MLLPSPHKVVSDLCQHALGSELVWTPVVWGVRGLCLVCVCVCGGVYARVCVIFSHEYVCFKPEGGYLWERVGGASQGWGQCGPHENE